MAEQRISHFVRGLAITGTMTGSLLTVLHPIPDALFAGVFVVGWDDLEGNGIMAKILYLVRAPRFVRTDESLLPLGTQGAKSRFASYLVWQIWGNMITN